MAYKIRIPLFLCSTRNWEHNFCLNIYVRPSDLIGVGLVGAGLYRLPGPRSHCSPPFPIRCLSPESHCSFIWQFLKGGGICAIEIPQLIPTRGSQVLALFLPKLQAFELLLPASVVDPEDAAINKSFVQIPGCIRFVDCSLYTGMPKPEHLYNNWIYLN